MNARKQSVVSELRIRPLIMLETCFQCLGRGYVLAVRDRKVIRERCTQCGATGSIVTDDAGAMPR